VANDHPDTDPDRQVSQLQRQLRAVHTIAAQLGREIEIDDLVRQALDVAMATVDALAGSILLHDPAQEKLVFRYVVGGAGDSLIGVPVDPYQSIAGRVFREGVTSSSDDVDLDADHDSGIEQRTQYHTSSMVTVPLKQRQDAALGVLQVLNKRGGGFDGNDIAVLEILADQIASRLQNARLQKQARLAAVAEYVGHVSHDLKNMMTPVQTGAQMLREILGGDAEQLAACLGADGDDDAARETIEAVLADLREVAPEIVKILHEGALTTQQHMADIANAVKGLSTEPTFEDADVIEVAERAVRLLSTQAEGLGVEVRLEPEGDLPHACVDTRLLYNAVYNLTFNALEACEGKGSVTVRLAAEGDQLRIDVADTGKGMPEEVRAKAFTAEAFSTKATGTGLGTRIVRNVVDAHRGTITVESAEGEGTTVTIHVPLARE
jgi:signal transduction histidine kinase